MQFIKRIFSGIYDFLEASTFALGFVMVTYLFLFQTAKVQGYSSYPTIQPNEMALVDKISYRFGLPQRGDFIIMQSPENPDVDFIKRVIGLPGETIKISDGNVYINGLILDEPYLAPGTTTSGNIDIKILPNYYFVMGDNRQNSSDSRVFGPISQNLIVGKVIFRFWPPDKLGEIH